MTRPTQKSLEGVTQVRDIQMTLRERRKNVKAATTTAATVAALLSWPRF